MSEVPQNPRSQPPSVPRELADAYIEGLLDYLVRPDEPSLHRAREIGRRALASGLAPSDLSIIHHESMRKILSGTLGVDPHEPLGTAGMDSHHESYLVLRSLAAPEGTFTLAAAGFFSESISPFEVNRRELRQENTALHYRASKLEAEVRQFSALVFDDTLQLVAAAALALDRAAGGNFDEVRGLLEVIGDQLMSGISNLRPRVLEDLGLGAAIQSIARRISASAKLDIVADTAVGPLLPVVSTAIFGAVEESLTNIMRHARAKHVRIRICDEAGEVHCTIGDDGVGFDASDALSGNAGQGSGLLFIRESLRAVGGTLTVHSTPGRGTQVLVTVRGEDCATR